MAQMSDNQVIEYVKEQYAAGASQNQIAAGLLERGVTQDQILRIRDSHQADVRPAAAETSRVREYNGETVPDKVESMPDTASQARKIFGHDLFRSKNLTFQPAMNIPAPASYKLGPGDEVILDIYGSAQATSKLKVAPDGSVTVPNEGPLYLTGLTLEQAQAKVSRKIGDHYEGSSVKLSLGQTRTIIVNVMGEVNTPGTYTLSAFSTVFNALYLAGGVTEIGTLRNIRVSRGGKIIAAVDVYDFILNGKISGNVFLQDNDVIMVGTYDNLVSIEGKVKRPMYYEMKSGESIKQLLSFAGGFTGDAFKDMVRVERRSSEGLSVHNVDKKDFGAFCNEDEDIVVVAPVVERYKNTVKVSGAVFRPGNYKLDEKVNSVKTVIAQAGGLLEQAVTGQAVLIRMKEDRTYATETVALEAVLNGDQPDVVLRNEDELIIASYTRLAAGRKMSIHGEVMNPGTFDYSENTTIGDLITMAGGLSEAATLEKVEVARRITTVEDNADGRQMSKVFSFDLDSSLKVTDTTTFTLQPYDQVTIHRSPNYKEQKSVYVGGEVLYEGFYSLSNTDERISSLIQRAGGLTGMAFPRGARLVRKYTPEEMKYRKHLLETAQSRADSISAYQTLRKTTYSVGIDLSKALEQPLGDNDIILEAGDSIYVPQYSSIVKISGEVLSPNTVAFKAGKGAGYYINQAGGVRETGRRSKAYILYANGKVSAVGKGKIEPGCEIVVPSQIEKKTDFAKVSMWATLASTVATVGAVVASIVK